MEIRSGTLTALYLFDVAEHFDLTRLREWWALCVSLRAYQEIKRRKEKGE